MKIKYNISKHIFHELFDKVFVDFYIAFIFFLTFISIQKFYNIFINVLFNCW